MGGPPREDIDASTAVRGYPRGEPTAELVPALTIAAHPDPARVGDRLVLVDLAARGEVQLSRRSPDFHRESSALGAPLADAFMSRRPIRIASAPGRRIRIVSDDGTAVAIGGVECSEVELGPLAPGDGVPIALADRILLVLHLVEPGAPADVDRMGMIGSGLGISRLRRAIAQICDLAVPVLIRGETGTGKELVASALHARGPRRHGPFVSVNRALPLAG